MKIAIGLVAAFSLLALSGPIIASAQTAPSVSTLSAQLAELQAQLAALTAGKGSSALPASCPALARTLARGATGTDVSALQKFLISQGLLTSDSATGFFGPMTESAVQKFQASHNVVSSGTPATTGYGLVGAKTRAAIAQACTRTNASSVTSPYGTSATKPIPTNPSCPLVALPIGTSCKGHWQEVKDTKGCTASWQCVSS